MLSAMTGYYPDAAPFPDIAGPVRSVYQRVVADNPCAHRDYQNIGVNGARAGAMNDTIQASMARAPHDRPALVFYALIGNDVCNGHPDTVAHMTTPADMRRSFRATLAFLDTRLPRGSKVAVMGLANGTLLWDALQHRTHPLGVGYPALYDYLNCLEISPCSGWMNSNATLRAVTQARADALSAVLREEVAAARPANFQTTYVENLINPVMRKWRARGGEMWQLIEPVDGFHPNQQANALLADEMLLALPAGWLPPPNPHAAEIRRIFGDQGGY